MSENTPPPSPARKGKLPLVLLRLAAAVIGWIALFALTAWAAAALYFDVRWNWLRVPAALLFMIGMVAAFIFIKARWRAAIVVAGGFVLVLAWWLALKPSNERDWLPDLARTAYAEINGNNVTLHNIRNCDYRTET